MTRFLPGVVLVESGAQCRILGIPFSSLTMEQSVDWILDRVRDDVGHSVHLCNAYTISCAATDETLLSTLKSVSLVLPDGISVYLASLVLRTPIIGRVPGEDLMPAVLARGSGLRHYLLGSTHQTLQALKDNCSARFPDAAIVGTDSPPFRPLTSRERLDQVERLRAAAPDIVWVGLGTPKQDYEAAWLASQLPAVAIAVGAAFDFHAGTKPRAPKWMRAVGMEWLFRMATEPRRLWRRYTLHSARFIRVVWRQARSSRASLQ